jgi:hypothetical protein
VTITVHDTAALVRYRFGFRTADFLVCAGCGVYVAAVMSEGSAIWGTVNANTLEPSEPFRQGAVPVSYDGETEEERRVRRRARWTPAVVIGC